MAWPLSTFPTQWHSSIPLSTLARTGTSRDAHRWSHLAAPWQHFTRRCLAVSDEYVQFANELADAAREIIMPYWRKPIVIESKQEGTWLRLLLLPSNSRAADHRAIAESPVTIADRATEQRMREMIESRFPTHGVFGEAQFASPMVEP